MRTTTAYFAGVGTVAVAITAGLGGGLLFSNIVAPHQPKYATEPTKLELRMAERSIPISSPPSEPAPAIAATKSVAPQPSAPTAAAAQAEPQPQPQKESPAAAEKKAASNMPAVQPATSAAPEQTAREPAASPREAFAKTRDVDLKRGATEKRRAERHQQGADKRRVRQPREQDLEAVEQAVRDNTEPRQAFASEPIRLDMRRVRLFGDD